MTTGMSTTSGPGPRPPIRPGRAWLHAGVLTAAAVAVVGVPNFVLLPPALAGRSLWSGSLAFLAVYASAVTVLVAAALAWWRRSGRSLADLGWRRPAPASAWVVGIVVGIAWLAFSLVGAAYFLDGRVDLAQVDGLRVLAAALGIIITVGEEILMRGLLMTRLREGGVPTWLQILASGAAFGLYHSVGSLDPTGLVPSVLIGCAWAGVYVLARRSLTPSIVSHGIVNVGGEPFLAMMILATH